MIEDQILQPLFLKMSASYGHPFEGSRDTPIRYDYRDSVSLLHEAMVASKSAQVHKLMGSG